MQSRFDLYDFMNCNPANSLEPFSSSSTFGQRFYNGMLSVGDGFSHMVNVLSGQTLGTNYHNNPEAHQHYEDHPSQLGGESGNTAYNVSMTTAAAAAGTAAVLISAEVVTALTTGDDNDSASTPTTPPATNPDPGKNGSNDLPDNPDDLLNKGYKEISHPKAADAGHRTFEDPVSGDKLRHDEGTPGAPGHEGQDHYHRYNPNATDKSNEYLDKCGNPVPRGSDPSHLYPP